MVKVNRNSYIFIAVSFHHLVMKWLALNYPKLTATMPSAASMCTNEGSSAYLSSICCKNQWHRQKIEKKCRVTNNFSSYENVTCGSESVGQWICRLQKEKEIMKREKACDCGANGPRQRGLGSYDYSYQ